MSQVCWMTAMVLTDKNFVVCTNHWFSLPIFYFYGNLWFFDNLDFSCCDKPPFDNQFYN
jgi:hypothetical protein